MKLYTETQVEEMLMKARFHNSDDTETYSNEYLIAQYRAKAIELPSDEEINYYANYNVESISFVNGAIWMRDKLKVLKDEE